jgi:hypothetical protein
MYSDEGGLHTRRGARMRKEKERKGTTSELLQEGEVGDRVEEAGRWMWVGTSQGGGDGGVQE